jgi:clorobiocin biosynthesis protein CloN3
VDFDFTDLQKKHYDEILTAVRERLGTDESPGRPRFTRERWRAAADIGLTGLCLPAGAGGGGLGALDTALGLQAFGHGCPDTGLVFAVAAHLLACAVPVRDFGQPAVRDALSRGMAAGELIAANAMTEDEAGSDLSRLAVTAERDGDGYILDGEKSFVSNGPVADVLVTYAVTDRTAGFLGISAFAVPGGLPGVRSDPPLSKMGLHGCPAGRVRFTRCRVPASHRLGEEGQGSAVFQHSMRWERACLGALYVGLMDRQLGQCVARARSRRQFGRPIGEFQAVSHRIAMMKQRLEGARLLMYQACWLLDRDRDQPGLVALAKTAVSEAAVANGIDAVQIFGAAGYLACGGIEAQLRDAVPATIFSGTTDIQRELIARDAGL